MVIKVFKALEVYLRGQAEYEYVNIGGNAGDKVQLAALHQFNAEHEKRVVWAAEVVVVQGGGWLNDLYPRMHTPLFDLRHTKKRVIMLPQTVDGAKHFELLSRFKNLVLMARDVPTFSMAKRYGIDTVLVEDLAFGLDYGRWSPQDDKDSKDVLTAFRLDRESAHARCFPGNVDLSSKYDNAHDFITEINRYKFVNTDRLHIAIVATLLGKEVQLWPGNYHKNRSVFDISLQQHSNITFNETTTTTA